KKRKYRSVIRFLFLDEKTCEEIKTKLDAVYRNSSPSMTTVRYWFNEFKRGRSSVFDEERPGRPADVVTEEIVEKDHDMILADRRTKVHEVAEACRTERHSIFFMITWEWKSCRLDGCHNQDNAPAHSSAVATAKLIELHYALLPHAPYSPDLASCDFFLFPNLKKWLGGKKFTSNEEVIAETEAYFAEFDKYFSKGLKEWQKRWEKCILLKGDYVGK
ncbi:MOS1T transposase, partial [Pseudoatta argentina]